MFLIRKVDINNICILPEKTFQPAYINAGEEQFEQVNSFKCLGTMVNTDNSILVYKSQQDAHVTEFILSDNCSTCFGRHYHPSSGEQNSCNYSIR